jgi:alpha-tubulin suppressor-like RCC1 family protein
VGSFFDGTETGAALTQEFPTEVMPLSNVTAIDAGNAAAYAVESNGEVYGWGDGSSGELGDGATAASEQAVRVDFPAGIHIVAIGEAEDDGFAID